MSTVTRVGKDRLQITLSKKQRRALREQLSLADAEDDDSAMSRSHFELRHLIDLDHIYASTKHWGKSANDEYLVQILAEYAETALPYLEERAPPALQHSSTPALQHSSTPALQHSSTPALQHIFDETRVIWDWQQYADVCVLGMPPRSTKHGFLLIGDFWPDLSSLARSVKTELCRVKCLPT